MGSVGRSQKPSLLPAQTTIIAPSIILAARIVIALVTILTAAAARNFLALKTILGVGNVLPALALLGGFFNDSWPKQVLR